MKIITRLFLLWACWGSINGYAWNWKDLWKTPDQQAQRLFDKHLYAQAYERFKNPSWKAAAAYRAGLYDAAQSGFKTVKDADGYYNQGNALAHMGQYEAALNAYRQALNINPHHQDANYNKKVIEALLKQDRKKQQNEQQDQKKQKEQKQQNNEKHNQAQDQKKQAQEKQDGKNLKNQNQEKLNQKEQLTHDNHKQKKPVQQNQQQSATENEKKRANEQWLNLVPDDPGGLLREKFLRDHLRRENGWQS